MGRGHGGDDPTARARTVRPGEAGGKGRSERRSELARETPSWHGCGIIAPMPTTHDVSSLVAEAAAERPDALAVVEAAGRSVTWAALED